MPPTAVEVAVAMATAQEPIITFTTWLRMMAKGGQSGPTADVSQKRFVQRFQLSDSQRRLGTAHE